MGEEIRLAQRSEQGLGCDAVDDVQDDSTETEESEALAGIRQELLRRRKQRQRAL